MKTAEEKARDASCDYGIDDIQHRTMFASGYLQGYNDAMRWRTFDEKPIIHTWILVRPKLYPIFKPKVKRVDVFVDLSKKYTHWRSIE